MKTRDITNLIRGSLAGYILLGVSVAACLYIGKLFNIFMPFLPSSLWGMLFFAIGLFMLDKMGLSLEALFHHPAQVIIKYLSFVFLPVCVGIIQYKELIAHSGAKILFVGMTSTLLTLSIVAWLSKKWLINQKHTDNV